MEVARFDYDLPKELIAQKPLPERDNSRLMVVLREKGEVLSLSRFGMLSDYLSAGDVLVMNNTRVVNARLYGKRRTGGRVEVFVLDPHLDKGPYSVLIRPSRRIRQGERIELDSGHTVSFLEGEGPERKAVFSAGLSEVMASGHVPLPPYIKRADEEMDRARYQTVYATEPGATAAPTAGLHFTERLLRALSARGVLMANITLHTGFGTFAPVKTDNVEDHRMHEEYYELNAINASKIERARAEGGKVIAVGSTSTRVLETLADEEGHVTAGRGYTDLFIYPPYRFKAVDGMITNFHLPRSTLLMMVAAFAGEELVLKAYRKAVREGYRFFSYGDAMLIM